MFCPLERTPSSRYGPRQNGQRKALISAHGPFWHLLTQRACKHTHTYIHTPACPGKPSLDKPLLLKNQPYFPLPLPLNSWCPQNLIYPEVRKKVNCTISTSRRRIDSTSPKSRRILKAWLSPRIWKSNSRPPWAKCALSEEPFWSPLITPFSTYLKKKKKNFFRCFYCPPAKAF